MGFCRRCGDIIGTDKCKKCGGAAVSGVVKIADVTNTPRRPDRWERKYTHRRSISPTSALSSFGSENPDVSISLSPRMGGGGRYPATPSPGKRFARPLSSEIERFGALTAITETPKMEKKIAKTMENDGEDASEVQKTTTDAVSSSEPQQADTDCDPTLTKVHGTLLSPPPPIPCHHCHTPFPPSATLYPLAPHPSSSPLKLGADLQLDPSTPYACSRCFTLHSSLGPCASCTRPVLPLRTEGKYVQLGKEGEGKRVWHARCFVCVGCGKDLSARPMVGMGGEPECEGCFGRVVNAKSSRKKRESGQGRGQDVVREMQGAFGSPESKRLDPSTPTTTRPTTPAAPLTPSRPCPTCSLPLVAPGQTVPLVHAGETTYHAACFVCFVCQKSFMDEKGSGTAVYALWEGKGVHVACAPSVTVTPGQTPTASPAPARPQVQERAEESAPTTPISSPRRRYLPSSNPAPAPISPTRPRPTSLAFPPPSSPLKSSVFPSAPPPSSPTRPGSLLKSPIFGGGLKCPACGVSVSPLEKGVVKGPEGGRWHAGCLVCGGGPGEEGELSEVGKGCGKKLDSGAKEAGGRVWCRGCWDALPATVRPASPTRASPLIPMHTGLSRSPSKAGTSLNHSIFPRAHQRSESLVPQMTGSGLPITRQLTGSTYTGGLSRQITGGSFAGTASGPVAQLVRQMTGNGQGTPGRRPRSLYAPSMLENVIED